MKTYFWKDGEVIELPFQMNTALAKKMDVENLYCIDEYGVIDETKYGKFTPLHAWVHVPLSKFPSEFRAQVLLLGGTP